LPGKPLITIAKYKSGRHHDLLQAGVVNQPHNGTAAAQGVIHEVVTRAP
jgi:hypothetical protein